MLRFIFFDIAIFDEIQDHFNTSHVTVYHDRIGEDKGAYFIFQYISCYGLSFPTLALIFAVPEFQYISCYGLSFSSINYLWFSPEFQYISCYGLSITVRVEKTEKSIFQYISCYGLSNDFKPFLSWHLSSFPLFYVISTFFTSRL